MHFFFSKNLKIWNFAPKILTSKSARDEEIRGDWKRERAAEKSWSQKLWFWASAILIQSRVSSISGVAFDWKLSFSMIMSDAFFFTFYLPLIWAMWESKWVLLPTKSRRGLLDREELWYSGYQSCCETGMGGVFPFVMILMVTQTQNYFSKKLIWLNYM